MCVCCEAMFHCIVEYKLLFIEFKYMDCKYNVSDRDKFLT